MNINVRGRLMDLSRPRVMGIINVTDNSFFQGSRYMQDDDIVRAAAMMLEHGADRLVHQAPYGPGEEIRPLLLQLIRLFTYVYYHAPLRLSGQRYQDLRTAKIAQLILQKEER